VVASSSEMRFRSYEHNIFLIHQRLASESRVSNTALFLGRVTLTLISHTWDYGLYSILNDMNMAGKHKSRDTRNDLVACRESREAESEMARIESQKQ
jgi:hypothetical protein